MNDHVLLILGLCARIEEIFLGKGQHCHFLMTVCYRIGDSHGPNGHAHCTNSKQEGRNLLSPLIDLLFHHDHVHHQISVLLTQQHFHHEILHGLVLAIGLAPDFDSLGPCRIFVPDLMGV